MKDSSGVERLTREEKANGARPQVVDNDETILIASTIVHELGCRPARIVLRFIEGTRHPFVTHRQSMQVSNAIWVSEAFDSGNYFVTLAQALADFVKRAAKELPPERTPADHVLVNPVTKGRKTVVLLSDVDPGWVEFVTGGPEGFCDVFMRDHSGFWLRRCAHDARLGWLVYDHAATDVRPSEETLFKANMSWRNGSPLPPDFYRLDEDAAVRSWQAGVRRSGSSWYQDGDGNDYDCALQQALLGEITYG